MNDIDIPILKKSYQLYHLFHNYRRVIPKSDKFTIFQRSEDIIIDILELLLEAGYTKDKKIVPLEKSSVKLNILRFLIRLMKDSKSIDNKKYIALQEIIDEIGRMLGGWIRSENTK